jgi:Gram-negative bacterial TonB protein C-terminal
MSTKHMRVIAAAALFFAAGVSFSFVKPLRTLAAGSPTAQLMAQYNPAGNPPPAQPNSAQTDRPREIPPARTPDQNETRNAYKPAKVVSAADVTFPFQTTADGLVVFDVSLDAQGVIKNISVLQDLQPFTAPAKQSLRSWKFAPASENGKPEDSEMPVAFVFRHAVYIANEPPFTPIVPKKDSDEAREGFIPPGILSVSYAGYPASTIGMGAVVVQARVKPDGSTGEASVVRKLPGGFGPLAIDAAKLWKFQPASRKGMPAPSNVAIAFVFSSRALNPF